MTMSYKLCHAPLFIIRDFTNQMILKVSSQIKYRVFSLIHCVGFNTAFHIQ